MCLFVLVNCLLNAFAVYGCGDCFLLESYCVGVVVRCVAFWLMCPCY